MSDVTEEKRAGIVLIQVYPAGSGQGCLITSEIPFHGTLLTHKPDVEKDLDVHETRAGFMAGATLLGHRSLRIQVNGIEMQIRLVQHKEGE